MRKTRIIFTISLILLILSGVGYAYAYVEVMSKKDELIILEQKSLETEEEVAYKAGLTSFLEDGDRLKIIDSFFVGKDGVVDFITKLENIAVAQNVRIDISSVNIEPSENAYFENLVLSIIYTGSWENILNYAKVIDTLPYALTTHTLNLEEVRKETNEGGVRIEWRGSQKISVLKLKE